MTEPVFDMSEITTLYKEDARHSILEMQKALQDEAELASGGPARQNLRRLSHQLRGSGRTYGFQDVTRISKAIESIVMKLEKRTLIFNAVVQLSLQKKVARLTLAFKD